MGNEQSSPSSHSSDTLSGFRILKNTSTTPPLDTLNPYFDFIVGINGRQIDSPHPHLFTQELTNIALYGARTGNAHVTLGIWSAKGGRLRDVVVPLELDDKIDVTKGIKRLGLVLQWCPVSVSQEVWHVLDVIPNSPADLAGMVEYGDWILGVVPGVAGVHGGHHLGGEGALGDLIEDYINVPLKLYVYNHDHDIVRELSITPNKTWGGSGSLGCVLGYGALHRLPPPLTEPLAGPGETLFEASLEPTSTSYLLQDTPTTYEQGTIPNKGYLPPNFAATTTAIATENLLSTYTPQFITPGTQYGPGARHSPAPPPSGTTLPPRSPPQSQTAAGSPPPPPLTQALPRPHPHRTHNKPIRKTHMSMDEFMRESEQKSREEDYVPNTSSSSKPGTPAAPGIPPPPMRTTTIGAGGVGIPPPPPRRSEAS